MTWKWLSGEIDAHIEEKALDLIDSGVPRDEAWARARREFGNATLTAESSREVWIWTWLERLWQDVVYARRMLTKHASVTVIAALSLALGVGANCAMFSFADALLLRPLPVPSPSEVLTVGSTKPQGTEQILKMSYPDYRDFRERTRSFAELAAFTMTRVRFATQAGAPMELQSALIVSGNFFAAMHVTPALGRVFLPNENDVPGRDAVMVLSHAFWKTRFAADPGVLDRIARVNGIAFTIVGVMPREFTGADQWVQPDFYVPAMMWPRLGKGSENLLEDRVARVLDVKGRLQEGVSLVQVQAEASVLARALATEHPDTNRNFIISVRTELQNRLEEGAVTGPIVAMLMLLALAVLLVACANVAGLLASRAPARAREMSIRLAIGAGRARIIRQLLTESLILALMGGIGGVAVGYASVLFLKQMNIVAEVPVARAFRLDERALLFSLAVALVSVFLFGLWLARCTARADLVDTLRAGGLPSASTPGRRHWTRNILVAGQIALSIVLLTVAAIMYVTFQRDLLAGPGFRTDHLLLARLDPNLAGYADSQASNFYRDLPARARAIPGVHSATLASGLPGGYDLETLPAVPEHYEFPEGQTSLGLVTNRADESYFTTMGIGIVRGRGFTTADDAGSTPVVVVNEVTAERYWAGQDPIGKRMRVGDASPWREIVGVAHNMKFLFLVERPRPAVYIPYAQFPRSRMTLVLESAGDPAALAAPLRELIRGMDANLPVYDIRNMYDTWNSNAVKPSLLIIQMIAAMGAMGVLLSLTGLYGLMAYSVSARQREIGIRMAIGAARSSVLSMVFREGLTLAGTGTALGLILGLAAGRLMVAVFPTHVPSVIVYAVVVPAVFTVTMLAAFLPARRASRVNPASALRGD